MTELRCLPVRVQEELMIGLRPWWKIRLRLQQLEVGKDRIFYRRCDTTQSWYNDGIQFILSYSYLPAIYNKQYKYCNSEYFFNYASIFFLSLIPLSWILLIACDSMSISFFCLYRNKFMLSEKLRGWWARTPQHLFYYFSIRFIPWMLYLLPHLFYYVFTLAYSIFTVWNGY